MKSEVQQAEVARTAIWRWRNGVERNYDEDCLAREEPLEIRVRGQSVAVTMRTPGHDAELAAGFLAGEGLVRDRGDILEIAPCAANKGGAGDNILNVFFKPGVELDLSALTRHVFVSSSCGICGKGTIEAVHQHFPPLHSDWRLEAAQLQKLPERCRAEQGVFALTGGLHAAAVFDERGEMLVLREDVGRHNAVDKALGHCLLSGPWPLQRQVLWVSGRASFEIVQKALAAQIAIVAAISAPSSLAVDFARESGQTLVGFLRGDGFNIYSHPERIAD